jgi:hypothetical protein
MLSVSEQCRDRPARRTDGKCLNSLAFAAPDNPP